jgi:hypothetical protein
MAIFRLPPMIKYSGEYQTRSYLVLLACPFIYVALNFAFKLFQNINVEGLKLLLNMPLKTYN